MSNENLFPSVTARIRTLRARLDELGAELPASEWLAVSGERYILECRLQEQLAQLGALVYDRLDPEELEGLFSDLEHTANLEKLEDPSIVADATTAPPRPSFPHFSPSAAQAYDRSGRWPHESGVHLPVGATRADAPMATPALDDITPEMLNRLQKTFDRYNHLQAAQRSAPRTLSDEDRLLLHASLDLLGDASLQIRTRRQQVAELERLETVLVRYLERWGDLPKRTNHALSSLLTARARTLQEAIGHRRGDEDLRRRVEAFFPRLSAHAKETQPGTVHGLARDHLPREATWQEDAAHHVARVLAQIETEGGEPFSRRPEDALGRLANDVRNGLPLAIFAERAAALLDAGIEPDNERLVRLSMDYELEEIDDETLIPLRRAVRLRRDEEDEARARGQDEQTLPSDWPWHSVLEGKRVAIVGGDARPDRMDHLQDTFGFASGEWIENISSSPRKLDALLARLDNGLLDTVIILRAWSSHGITDRLYAMRGDGVDVILAEGYAVEQLRLAIERYEVEESVPVHA
ncbi:MAG: hypothetical protein EA398_01460 [Deltaproteobacteria bacterium]|nr:MAG: hypothetical protein EA398_01460 [Deltaproteobacteria bacterium]